MGLMTDEEITQSLATTLFDTVRELDRHIAERAHRIADPRIAETEQRCTDMVNALMATQELERQRLEDLVRELRRQLAFRDRTVAQFRTYLIDNGVNPLTGLPKGGVITP